MTATRSLVVVATAEADVTDDLAETLRDRFTVRTAYSADGLLASLDPEVDVVLVDRDLSGDPLRALRARSRERTGRWKVGLLTDDPDTGPPDSGDEEPAVAGVDAVVPTAGAASESAVRDAVDDLVRQARYRKRLEEYYAVAEEYADLMTGGSDDADDGESDPLAEPAETRDAATDDGDREAERDRLERLLERLQSDLAAAFERLNDQSVFEAALDEPDPDEYTTAADPDEEFEHVRSDGPTGDRDADDRDRRDSDGDRDRRDGDESRDR
jgi:hypothetical protein